jgi:hypothetical protein
MFLTKDALLFDFGTMRLAAAREAVSALGLLKPAAEAIICHCLDARLDDHPRARCLAYRKHGEQLSIDEKRSAGLRANAFFSWAAYDELTDAGRREPLKAHETTLLRAVFTMFRYGVVTRARAEIGRPEFDDKFKHETTHTLCPGCNEVDGIVARGDQVELFPPSGCTCLTANYILKPHIDRLAGID